MTTTTLTALNTSNGVAVCFVAIIEGYSYALTDGDPTQVLAACTGGLAGHDVTDVQAGLCVMWDQRDSADPWKPIGDPPMLRFRVLPGRNVAGVVVDTFGRDVFRRTAAHETYLRADLDQNDTTVAVASTTGFAASGVAHLGGESFTYSGVGATSFTGVTRATYAPFQTESGVAFSRTHKTFDATTQTGDALGVRLQPVVSSEPRNGLVGRQVGVWILAKNATGYEVTSQGHLAFAGTIAEADEAEDGWVDCAAEEIRRKVYETPILRDQFRAKIKEGISLVVGANFDCYTWREIATGGSSSKTANPLVIVASGASGANQLDAGIYTASELGDKIQAWLQAEKSAARLLFNVRYSAMAAVDGGFRAVLEFEDPTATVDLVRKLTLSFGQGRRGQFLGWGEDVGSVEVDSTTRTGSRTSSGPPLRIFVTYIYGSGSLYSLTLENPSGTWIDQASLLPPATTLGGQVEGVLKFGTFGYVVAHRISDTSFEYADNMLTGYLPSTGLRIGVAITVEDDTDLEVRQVLLAEDSFRNLFLKVLLSTGTSGYNSATYDTLSEGIGCGVPFSLASGIEADLLNIAESDRLIRLFVEKPTRFSDLFSADFQLRWAFLSWSAGGLRMRAWTTPVADYATLALTEAMKGVPFAQAAGDKQRAASSEPVEAIYNDIKILYGRDADGNYTSDLEVADTPSMRDHGARPLTIEARNAAPSDVVALIASYSAALPLFTRPHRIIRRTLLRQYFEQCTVGTLVTISDRHIRNPDTGLRYSHQTAAGGLVGWPGIVVGHRFDWGGPEGNGAVRAAKGEIDVMIFDRVTHAPYSPCAQFRGSNYDAGTFTATCLAHEHSESSATLKDAENFAAGDKVTVVEVDPATAASPLTWSMTVASQSSNDVVFAADLSPGFDSAKLYRIISAAYATAVATQKTDTYQADDVAGTVVATRQPYGMIYSGAGQSNVFTTSPSTELPAKYATLAVGDGKPYDTGYDRDIARGLNNLVDHKTAPQSPTIHEDADTFGGAGTYELVRCRPIWIGQGALPAGYTIKLAAAPYFKSTDGTTATVRLTLSKFAPEGADRDDVLFPEPYVQVTFTTTSTTYAIATAQDLDTRIVNRSEGQLGGVGFLSVEIKNKTSVQGVGHLLVGEREVA